MTFAIVLDSSLPPGLAANAAAVLAMSVGKRFPEYVGNDVCDRDGSPHRGITSVPLPILALDAAALGRLRETARTARGIWMADFTHVARAARDYGTYARDLAGIGGAELGYVGIVLAGEKADLKRLTGSLPLFR